MSACVLIVEDDARLRKFFMKALKSSHYEILAASSAEEAIDLLRNTAADLVLSDVVLKGKSGVILCKDLRSRPETAGLPVVLVSGERMGEDDQVEGLEAGADDYLLKPVSGKVLAAKIESVLRRYRAPHDLAKTLKIYGLTLDVRSRIATLRGEPIRLTRKEFDLLTAFLSQRGEVLSHEYLLKSIWGVDPTLELNTRTLTVHVSSLKTKLGGSLGNRISNVPRLGYCFRN